MMVAGESAPVLCRYAHGASTGLNHTQHSHNSGIVRHSMIKIKKRGEKVSQRTE
jgi:hypothetical protein